MKTPIHRDKRLDDLDAQQFEAMLASKPWMIYMERLAAVYQRWAMQCTNEDNELILRRAQGAAEAMRVAIAIPKTLLEEMRKKPNNPA